jgi:uncharacterized membrane protein
LPRTRPDGHAALPLAPRRGESDGVANAREKRASRTGAKFDRSRATRLISVPTFAEAIEAVGRLVDAAGVAAIALGIVLVAATATGRIVRRDPDVYSTFRHQLGRAILLGLELLVAADIIRTVAVRPTLDSVVVLGVIVVVRTFLSFSLEVELTGRWPWQREVQPT